MKLGIIGAGTVGTALAVKLSQKGYAIAAVYSRSKASASRLAELTGAEVAENPQYVADSCEMVFITTPDDVIPSVVESVEWHAGQNVVHCSGADSTAVLDPAKEKGANVGGFHPLQTFASIKQAIDNIPGSTFAIEAEEPLLSTLKELASALGCHWIKLEPEDKAAYHASAVIACNYMVTLVKLATDLWRTLGIPQEEATRALMPLIKGTLHNIESAGIPKCLTGPIARGDIGTIRKHLDTLAEKAPEMLSTYCELGLKTIPVALAKGKIDKERATELEAILSESLEGEAVHAHNAKK